MNQAGVQIIGFLVSFLAIIVSMTLHEIMHGFVAYKLGDDTAKNDGRLTLNPIKHLDPVYSLALPLIMFFLGGPMFGGAKPVPVNSRNLKGGAWGMALVAIMGPVVNLLLAYINFLFNFWFGSNEIIYVITYYFLFINLGFFCFNILPIPPLDGSRLLYAIAPDGVRRFLDNLELRMGVFLIYIIILVFGGIFSSIILNMENGILQFFLWTVGG